jgi:hypothetical protein
MAKFQVGDRVTINVVSDLYELKVTALAFDIRQETFVYHLKSTSGPDGFIVIANEKLLSIFHHRNDPQKRTFPQDYSGLDVGDVVEATCDEGEEHLLVLNCMSICHSRCKDGTRRSHPEKMAATFLRLDKKSCGCFHGFINATQLEPRQNVF